MNIDIMFLKRKMNYYVFENHETRIFSIVCKTTTKDHKIKLKNKICIQFKSCYTHLHLILKLNIPVEYLRAKTLVFENCVHSPTE